MSTERLKELLKAYEQASMEERDTRTISRVYRRTWIGIDVLVEIFSLIYSRKTGIPRKITKAEALDIAVDKTVKATLAELKKAAEER